MANNQIKRCLPLLVTTEINIKIQLSTLVWKKSLKTDLLGIG